MRRGLVLAVLLLAVGLVTLWPAGGDPVPFTGDCAICSVHGTADLLLNIVLFIPLGAAFALRWSRQAVLRAFVYGAVLSTSIEVAQLFIPGRDSSYGDIAANALGAAAGALLAVTSRWWLAPTRPRAVALCAGAALAAAAICGLEGLLLTPTFPDARYFGMWTPNLGHLTWYRGRALDVSLSGVPIAHGWIDDARIVRESPFTLRVRVRAGPPPPGLAPFFAIYDDQRREIVLLGADGHDLVFRIRTLAAQLRLDWPDLRVVDGLSATARDDTLEVSVAAHGGVYAFVLNGRPLARTGYTVGNGWGLLMYPEFLSAWLRAAADLGWIAALFVPLGFWLPSRGAAWIAAAALGTGLLGAPAATALVATPPAQWIAAVAGVLAGVALHVFISRRLAAQEAGRDQG